VKPDAIAISMRIATDRWMSRHRDHVGQVVEVKIVNGVEWPAGRRILRHFKCGECRDELKLELTIGAA